MKFGTKLRNFTVPEWSDKYIRYKELSRLAKRASRLKSGKIKGVEDETEKALLENLFTMEDEILAFGSRPVLVGTNSRTPSKEFEPPELNRCSSAMHLTHTRTFNMPVLEEPSSVKPSHEEPQPHEIGDSYATYAKELSLDGETELVKSVVEQYSKEGYLWFEKLSSNPENIPHLYKALRDLDKVELAVEKRLALNTKHDENNPPEDLKKNCDLSGSNVENKPEPDATIVNIEEMSRTEKKQNAASKTTFAAISRSIANTCCNIMKSDKRNLWTGGVRERFNLGKHTPSMQEEALSMFHKILRDDIRVVIIHYVTEMEYIKSLVRFLKSDIVRKGKLDDSYAVLIRKACTAFWDSCDKLRLYLNLNTLAVFKVLKKKDKLMGTTDVFNLYPTYKNILLSLDTSASTVDEVAQIYNSLMDHMVVDFTVLKRDMEATLDSMRPKPAHGLFFIYGLCTVLVMNSIFLCSFNFNYDFNMDLLLSQIPNFRFFFIMSLVWLGFGWCQNYLETYGVNYQFQFGISSNYAASEKDYYLIGVFHMLSCLALFVAFVLDCRLHLIPPHNFYFVYSILLIIVSIVVAVWPHENLKLKMRKKLLKGVLRVLGAPFGVGEKVTLADSIIADVMTSLTRPLRDLVCMITYFCVGMFSDKKLEPPKVHTWIIPLVMCYPYFIRFSQCLRRYINEKRWLHVGNMLKYVSGISCVVVSSIDWVYLLNIETWQRHLIVISFYVIATLFQCWWDFVIDWGLDLSWNMFKTRQNRCMYRRKAYYTAVVFNMACRCTWALTTMPFTLMQNKELSSCILFLLVSVIEIVRRAVWVTFRLESEHLLNSYKYRTALWVPKLYNCKNLIVKEMKMLNEQL